MTYLLLVRNYFVFGLADLFFDNHLHLGERYRAEVVIVHPDIVLPREEVHKPREVLPSVLLPAVLAIPGERPGVDVAEELSDVACG